MKRKMEAGVSQRKTGAKALLALLLSLALLTGCEAVLPGDTGTPAPEVSSGQGDMAGFAPDLSPQADEAAFTYVEVPLYFRMREESMLARETRTVRVPTDRRLESVLIEAMIEGPSASLLELTGVFNAGTEVVKVEESGTLLTVTLGRTFLDKPADAPLNWQNNASWRTEVLLRRRLALLAIVNTITEITDFIEVQFLIQESAADLSGRRILRSELYEGAYGDTVMPPIRRDEQALLTHFNTAAIILESWLTKDFTRLYQFVAERPTEAEFQEKVITIDRSLIEFAMLAGNVFEDGQSAVLTAELRISGAGGTVVIGQYPIHMKLENGVWRIPYEKLIKLMEAT